MPKNNHMKITCSTKFFLQTCVEAYVFNWLCLFGGEL